MQAYRIATRSILSYLFISNILATTIYDLKPRLKISNKHNFLNKYKGLLESLKNKANYIYREISEEIKEFPASYAIASASICLSGAAWNSRALTTPTAPPELPKGATYLIRPIVNILSVPELNGNGILNLTSFFHTLRALEKRNGSKNVTRIVSLNLIAVSLVASLLGKEPNFFALSRALTIVNCLECPEDSVRLYGLISVSQRYLPLLLIIGDYFFTMRIASAIQGCIGTVSGFLTHHATNALLNSKTEAGCSGPFSQGVDR